VHPAETRAAALELHRIGLTPAWIGRELGVPRRTIAYWLRGNPQRRRVERPRPLPPQPYAYLLGLYLGDGYISETARRQPVLKIACDAAYPEIIAAAQAAITAVVPARNCWLTKHPSDRWTCVASCSRWWPVVFPQHGSGRKHERRIVLTGWQRAITATHPRELVKGLMHSDGCRFIANQRVGVKTYRYTRYSFSNRSDDIRGILCEHLDLLGIRWTRPNAHQIAVDRRAEVAKLDGFVGPKR
jgi:hypothetical protein